MLQNSWESVCVGARGNLSVPSFSCIQPISCKVFVYFAIRIVNSVRSEQTVESTTLSGTSSFYFLWRYIILSAKFII